MKRFRVCCMVLLLTEAMAAPAYGQSPYQCSSPKDWWLAGACILGGAGAAVVEQSTDPITQAELNQLSREDVNPFDRGATYHYSERISDGSYILAGVVVAAPLVLLLDSEVKNSWEIYALMYAETMAFAVMIPGFAKGSVERIRPFAYNPDVASGTRMAEDARGSFFSRHTSMAFASAVFLSTVHGAYHPDSAASPYLWAGTLLAATTVGLMRIESGDHFPTDVMVGAAVGSAIGYLVPQMHRAGSGTVSLAPVFRGSEPGIVLELKL